MIENVYIFYRTIVEERIVVMMNPKRRNRIFGILLLAVVVVIVLLRAITTQQSKKEELTYDQVVNCVRNHEVVKVEAVSGETQVIITLTDGTTKNSIVPSVEELSNIILQENEKNAAIQLEIKKGKIGAKDIAQSFSYFFMIGMLYYILRGNNSQKIKEVKSKVRFSDIAGIEQEKEQLQQVVDFLRKPERYREIGAKIPKGILLSGDPGTGKTLLAEAIAGEAGVPFFQVSASCFEEMFVGVGASRIRKLFREAKKRAPCIIFIDEIDSVAKSRYNSKMDSEQTLNQLLAEMDGFERNDKVIVIAATNHKDVLDPAILRSGRFDRHIFIPMPDTLGREQILKVHARGKKLEQGISFKQIASKTIGFSGADLANVLNEAAIIAVSQSKQYISAMDIDEAIARILLGLEKKQAVISEEDKKTTAIHEAGHAIVSKVLQPNVKNLGISIIQRERAGGYNYFSNNDARYVSKTEMLHQIAVLYGGRIAEEILLGDISNGAANDLEKASQIAYLMVTKFAMGDQLMVKIEREGNYNEQIEETKRREAEKICQEAYKEAMIIVKREKENIQELAKLLCEKGYLSQEEVGNFLKKI